MWAGADPSELQATWADRLSVYEPADFRTALEAMPLTYRDWPPNLFQFEDLCRDARRKRLQITQALPAPKTDMPEAIKSKLRQFLESKK